MQVSPHNELADVLQPLVMMAGNDTCIHTPSSGTQGTPECASVGGQHNERIWPGLSSTGDPPQWDKNSSSNTKNSYQSVL